MWSRTQIVSPAEQGGPGIGTGPMARSARGDTPACCGQAMEPELAEARTHSGQKLFITVWRCPRCRRVLH